MARITADCINLQVATVPIPMYAYVWQTGLRSFRQ